MDERKDDVSTTVYSMMCRLCGFKSRLTKRVTILFVLTHESALVRIR